GRPVVVEGAGLAWLTREYDGRPMCGVLNATGHTGEYLIVGYRDATARSVSPSVPLGTRLVGHKLHRGLVTPRSGEHPAWQWLDGCLVGVLWTARTDGTARCTESSYIVAPAARGYGVAAEAVDAVAIALVLEHGFGRVELRIAPGNTASRRVAEKAGFLYEGL